MAEPHWTDVDGVTTVWTETGGPLTGGLLFRAGRADETLATAGHTHLIEHLALSSLPRATDRQGGAVGGAWTMFGTMDCPEEVANFIVGVCRGVVSLPGERLQSEKQVLEAENAARAYDCSGNLLVWRYGAAGYGLTGLPEYGLRGATLPQLHAVTAQRFTRENVILWLSGRPPAGFQFELPHGVKQPVPRRAPVLAEFPAWFLDDNCGGVAVSALVPRVSAATFFQYIATKRMRERLRVEEAVSYAPSIGYEPLDAGTAHLVLYADSGKGRRAELVKAFCEFFERLHDIAESEVESARKEILDHWIGPLAPGLEDQARAELQRAALNWIFDHEHESIEMLVAEARGVTAADVSAFGRGVQSGALFALPGEAKLRPAMGNAAPASTMPTVEGRQIVSNDAPLNRARLVHGTDGVTLRVPDGSNLTVRYANLGAALSYDDGCVTLIAADATHIIVEPTLWRSGPRICREIRERIPAHLLLDQGPRPANFIPKPSTTRWQRVRFRLAQLTKRLAPGTKILAFIIAAVLFCGLAAISQAPALALPVIFLLIWAFRSDTTS